MAIQPRGTGDIKVDTIDEKTASAGIALKKSARFTTTGAGVRRDLDTAASALGTTQGGASALTHEASIVTSATAGSNECVLVPDLATGQVATIVNASNAPIKVFPLSGGSLHRSSANVGMWLNPGDSLDLLRTSSTQWYVV